MQVLQAREDPGGRPLIWLPSILSLGDIAATLIGQSDSYWKGDFSVARDANPIVQWALGVSPWLAVPAAIAWVSCIAFAMTRLLPSWRRHLYFFLCTAHLVFVWGWIVRASLGNGLGFSCIAVLVAVVMRRQWVKDCSRSEEREFGCRRRFHA